MCLHEVTAGSSYCLTRQPDVDHWQCLVLLDDHPRRKHIGMDDQGYGVPDGFQYSDQATEVIGVPMA